MNEAEDEEGRFMLNDEQLHPEFGLMQSRQVLKHCSIVVTCIVFDICLVRTLSVKSRLVK